MIDGGDLELFEGSLRHATETASGEALDAALDELGWRDAFDVDRRTAVSRLFELQGRAGTTSSALDRVVAAALGAEVAPSSTVILPALGRTDAPGRPIEGGTEVRGLATAAVQRAGDVVVAIAIDGGHAVALVAAKDLALRSVGGMDPALGLVEVTSERVRATATLSSPPAAWAEAVAAGQRAIAHELIGASRTMLCLARDHAVERIQFDQPIARFQAVRHRLADAFVAIESAEAAVGAAWEDGSPLAASVAKAVAGRSARVVARHCQQVLAGIGFTTEHPLHRSIRRVLILDRVLGDARSLTRAVGEELLRTRRLPPMLPL